MNLLDGLKISEGKVRQLKKKVLKLKKKPQLVILQVGNIEASNIYIAKKVNFGERIGVKVFVHNFDYNSGTKTLINAIEELNDDKNVSGIIVQLPLPKQIDKESVLNTINPLKDVDGLTARNIWKLMDGDKSGIVPATARGIQSLLKKYKVNVSGKIIVIVGDSILVGKSSAMYFSYLGATITLCNEKTKKLKFFTKQADILIVGVGKEGLIKKEHVKKGQIIIDVGINKHGEKIVGDVDFDDVKNVVSYITPVPGGVGPMTVVSLFENLIENS